MSLFDDQLADFRELRAPFTGRTHWLITKETSDVLY